MWLWPFEGVSCRSICFFSLVYLSVFLRICLCLCSLRPVTCLCVFINFAYLYFCLSLLFTCSTTKTLWTNSNLYFCSISSIYFYLCLSLSIFFFLRPSQIFCFCDLKSANDGWGKSLASPTNENFIPFQFSKNSFSKRISSWKLCQNYSVMVWDLYPVKSILANFCVLL